MKDAQELAAFASRQPPNIADQIRRWVSLPSTTFLHIGSGIAAGGQVVHSSDACEITTEAGQWTYAATWQLKPFRLQSSSALIKVQIQVETGAVSVAVNRKGNISELIGEVELHRGDKVAEIAITLPEGSLAEHLVLRNASSVGASKARIFSISSTQRRDPAPVDVSIAECKANGGTVTPTAEGARIETPAEQWFYAAIWGLQKLTLPPRSGFVRVRLRLEAGAVGISVNKKGDFSVLMNEVQVVDKGRILDVDIDLDDVSLADNLVVRNVSPVGPSQVNVLAIGVS